MAEKYDVAVVGGGIAGLAIAEMFARSGRSVALIEKNHALCQEASASQHGWFHFGSLYSIFPQNHFLRTMIRNIENLLDYYAGFEGLNIRVGENGRLVFPQNEAAWLRDEPIEYLLITRKDPDFDLRDYAGIANLGRKLFFMATWETAIKQFISRHRRFWKHDWRGETPASEWIPRAGWLDYSREVFSAHTLRDIALSPQTHKRVVGYDRPMRAHRIIADLARALLGAGGKIFTRMEVENIERLPNGEMMVHGAGNGIRAGKVVVSAGKWLGRFLPRSDSVSVVASPLLVAYPAVSEHHFVRMTPFVEKSVNHIWHEVEGRCYSLIGGGYFADPNDPQAVARAIEDLRRMAAKVFPALKEAEFVQGYLGYKTEVVPKSGERNYQYFIRQAQENVWAVVPGKFTLGFSLALDAFRKITGEEPSRAVRLAPVEAARPHLDFTRHARIVIERTARAA